MDCFYDGNSLNWKICWSSGCFAANSTTVQDPPAVRLESKTTVALSQQSPANCAALPPLQALGGDVFLSILAATLNVYRDRIDNEACADSRPDYMETLVSSKQQQQPAFGGCKPDSKALPDWGLHRVVAG